MVKKEVSDKLTVFGLNNNLEESSIIIDVSNRLYWSIIESEKRKGEYIIEYSTRGYIANIATMYITASERTKILTRYEALKAKYA